MEILELKKILSLNFIKTSKAEWRGYGKNPWTGRRTIEITQIKQQREN